MLFYIGELLVKYRSRSFDVSYHYDLKSTYIELLHRGFWNRACLPFGLQTNTVVRTY